jgi:hypothetical protein
MSALNGRLLSNGWQLVWTNEDPRSLSEADYMMPKIVPGSFFGNNVVKAMYLEPEHLTSIPSIVVIWFLMARQLEASAKKGMPRLDLQNGLVEVPTIPARSVALFGHTYGDSGNGNDAPSDEDQASDDDIDEDDLGTFTQTRYVHGVAEYILQQKGMSLDGRAVHSSWPNRQVQAYKEVIRWQENGMKRFQLVDTFLIVHDIRDGGVGRRLRCEWYGEQLFWSNVTDGVHGNKTGPNRDLEDLSLSYILHREKREGRLRRLLPDNKWGEKIQDYRKAIGGSKEVKSQESGTEYFVTLQGRMKSRKMY